jgi:uncharacterized protein
MSKEKCECSDCHCAKKPVIFIGVIAVLILLVLAFIAGAALSKESKVIVSADGTNLDIKTLSVSGSVTKNVAPNKVDIVLSFETLDLSAQKSQSDNAITADNVKTALTSLSSVRVEVKTLSYSVNEEFEWNDITKKSESIGYRTVNQIQVTLNGDDVARAGTVIDVAVGAGSNKVSSIAFGLTDARELEVRKLALQEASSVAKSKADSIASGLSVVVGKVHSISESSFYYTPNYQSFDSAAGSISNAKVATPISVGDVEVNATVSVNFEIN